MAERQPYELSALTEEHRTPTDEQCADTRLDDRSKGRIEFVFTRGLDDKDLTPNRAACRLRS